MHAAVPHPDFVSMFARFNHDIWPWQVLTFLAGAFIVISAFRKNRFSDRISAAALGLIWIFNGAVFHWMYFRPIYDPAGKFAVLWILQGVLFVVFGAIWPRLSLRFSRDGYAVFGLLLTAYGFLFYPALGYLLRSDLSHVTSFGAFPCPVGAFTIGILLLTDRQVPKYLTIIPLLWALGGVVPVSWGITEDIGLLAGGTAGIILLYIRDYRRRRIAPEARNA